MTNDVAPDSLEFVPCDLCGANDAEPVLGLRDRMFETTSSTFQLVRCRCCGLLYLNPRPTLTELDRYYQESYTPFSRSGISGRMKRLMIGSEVESLWSLLAPPARVIDVGCATGEMLQAIRERGNPNVLGLEPSAHAADLARDRFGLDIVTGTLEQACMPDQSRDVALLSHVIEHLPSPSRTVAELQRVLSPGGALIIWLPNARSVASRLLGEYWIGYDAPRHFYAFTPTTLTRLLDQYGFQVRSVSHEWIGLEWSWALRLWMRARVHVKPLDRLLGTLHPLLTAALTPISATAASARRAGRIRVVAVKI
jgi:ubiquinone/menaquinone biosynthesis C-methylase UbiE